MSNGGLDTGSKSGSKKGKAKMSQAAWDKLTRKQQDMEFGGSRFLRATTGPDRERGRESQKE